MIVVPKQDGKTACRTVDLQGLNKVSERQTHPMESPFLLAAQITAGKIKSVLDIWNSSQCLRFGGHEHNFDCETFEVQK